MTTVSYPSEQHPGPVPVRLEIPDGWESLGVPGVVLAVRQREQNAGFTPNVIVRETLRQGLDQTADVVRELERTLDGHAGAAMSHPTEVDLGGTTFTRVEVGFDDPSGVRVEQIHVFHAAARPDGLQTLVHATGGVGVPGGEQDRETVERVLASLRVWD